MTSLTTSAAPANQPMNHSGSQLCILPCMKRRTMTLTLAFTVDDDLMRVADSIHSPDGTTAFQDTIDILRTTVHLQAAQLLSPLDPALIDTTITYGDLVDEPAGSLGGSLGHAPVCPDCGAVAKWNGTFWETAHEHGCLWVGDVPTEAI